MEEKKRRVSAKIKKHIDSTIRKFGAFDQSISYE